MSIEPCTVLVWGDSIAASGWPQQTEFIYNVVQNTGRSIRVVNKGVGGLPAATACGQFNSTVLPERPDIVIIQFGFNDLRYDGSRGGLPISTPDEFGAHLADMIRMCRERAGAHVIVFGNHRARSLLILPSGIGYDKTRAQYNAVAQGVAKSAGVRFCDMAEMFAVAGLCTEDIVNEDGVHLSAQGLRAYAQIAANEIMRILPGVKVREST